MTFSSSSIEGAPRFWTSDETLSLPASGATSGGTVGGDDDASAGTRLASPSATSVMGVSASVNCSGSMAFILASRGERHKGSARNHRGARLMRGKLSELRAYSRVVPTAPGRGGPWRTDGTPVQNKPAPADASLGLKP